MPQDLLELHGDIAQVGAFRMMGQDAEVKGKIGFRYFGR